jgi:hypothetical protein
MKQKTERLGVALGLVGCVSLTACAVPWKTETLKERSISASHVIGTIPERVLTGGHCESAALINALIPQGYDVSEPLVIGAGSAPSFIFIPGTFPFIGARREEMKERFFATLGIAWHRERSFDWETIYRLLDGGIPVALRVDMRFLPYRYGGKNGPPYMSFGGHWITLFAVDAARKLAYVSDREYAAAQEISLESLHRARTSSTKNLPPLAEYCWVERVDEGFTVDWERAYGASLRGVIENYEGGALERLSAFGEDLRGIEDRGLSSFLTPSVLAYLHDNIEEHGTGGASFRVLYGAFLDECRDNGVSVEPIVLDSLDACVASWHDLASCLKDVSGRLKGMDREARSREFLAIKARADELYKREKAFYTVLRNRFKG